MACGCAVRPKRRVCSSDIPTRRIPPLKKGARGIRSSRPSRAPQPTHHRGASAP
ncbi:hypothetical protein [Lysobacter gummosus]|uniref:hypothetical protein n=1 Tax=Lysobacter gummosus TaxID=262324 RepID=UPI00362F7DCC